MKLLNVLRFVALLVVALLCSSVAALEADDEGPDPSTIKFERTNSDFVGLKKRNYTPLTRSQAETKLITFYSTFGPREKLDDVARVLDLYEQSETKDFDDMINAVYKKYRHLIKAYFERPVPDVDWRAEL